MKAHSRRLATLITSAVSLCLACAAVALQAPAVPATSVARVLGTVTAVDGNTVTVRSDAGVEQKIVVQDVTRMLETAPGQTNLSGATAIHMQDLQVGDRVSARGTMSNDGTSLSAISLIAMKQADVQKKQDADREDWQKRGVGGVVKSVDAAAATVSVTIGGGATAKPLAIHVGKTTVIRRYAADSAKLSDAKPATLGQIKPGDELQAKGMYSEDGAELAAEEIVVGSFRNLAGTITAVDKEAGTITFTDLATKKPYVIRCTTDSQLRKLSPSMAEMLAAKLKSQNSKATVGNAGARSSSANPSAAPAGQRASTAISSDNAPGAGQTGNPHADGSDSHQLLSRAPAIHLSDLQKGDVVMVVGTEGTPPGTGGPSGTVTVGSSTAITLIDGVGAMLQASASGSQNLLSSSWSIGSGGPGGEGAQ